MFLVPPGQAPAAAVHLQAQFIDAVYRVHALVSEQAAPKPIETPEQRELRTAAGCDAARASSLGRPADAPATSRLLSASQAR